MVGTYPEIFDTNKMEIQQIFLCSPYTFLYA